MNSWQIILLLLVLLLTACGSGSLSSEQAVNIRIHNQTVRDIDQFWLGAGVNGGSTKNTAFGRIGSGDTTRYAQVEPNINNYRKMNFRANGERYLDQNIDPAQHLDHNELRIGSYYTFAYNIIDGELKLQIILDSP